MRVPKKIQFNALAFILTVAVNVLQAQPVQVSIIVNPLPSPYWSDWEVDDQIAIANFNGNFPQPVQVIIQAIVTEQQHGQMVEARSEIISLNQGPWNFSISNPTMLAWPFLELHPMLEGQQATGLIPDGNYTLCVQVLNASNNNPMGNGCGNFNILLPEPPQITAPTNGAMCSASNLVIQWMPVQWIPNHPVTYNVTIAEMYANQMPQEAIESNPVHFETTILGATAMIYPFEGLPLEPGHSYAIVVQATDENDNPIGSNSGYSQVEYCTIGRATVAIYTYPWQPEVDEFTSEEFLENVALGGNPCDEIRELINKLQARLAFVLAEQGKAKDKSDKAKKDQADAGDDLNKANDDLAKASDELDKANEDRQTILDAIVSSSGGTWGKWNNGEPDCKGAAVIGPRNGDLQLGGDNAICLGASQIDKFIDQVNKWRDDLKALNKKIDQAEKDKADAEKRKEDAEKRKEKAENDQKDADNAQEKWKAEADALKDALDKLKKLAEECDIIIEDLQAKYDEAKKKIDDAQKELDEAEANAGGGGNSKAEFDEAQKKLDEANKHLGSGAYEDAKKSAEGAGGHTAAGSAWAEAEDCLKKAKAKLDEAKKTLAEQKANYPGGDFSEAEAAIAQAEKDIAAAEDAYKKGDLEAVNALCPKIAGGADEAARAAGKITCNEGEEKEIPNVLVEEHFVGKLIMPFGVTPENIGYKMKELIDAIGDPLDISYFVDAFYSLTSVSYVKTAYDMYYEKRCTEVLVCKRGKWVHKGYKDCTEGVAARVVVEMIFTEIDMKERLESDLSNIFDELKKYVKK